jgi:hypothetical protein
VIPLTAESRSNRTSTQQGDLPMTFTASTYTNMVSELIGAQTRLVLQYIGPRNDFDIIIVGSGVGGNFGSVRPEAERRAAGRCR